jgi:hypothetical protein
MANATTAPTVVPAVPNKLTFGQPLPLNTVAGAAMSPAPTVQLYDQFGNLTTSSSSIALTINTNTCGGSPSVTNGTVNASSGTATFSNMQITKTCTGYTLTATDATDGNITVVSSAFNITTGPVTMLVFSTTPSGNQTASATATIGAYQIQEQDQFGNPVTAGTAVAVNVSSNSSGTKFFSLSSGGAVGTMVTTVTITSGQSTSGNFYYSDTKAGTPTLTAQATGVGINGVTSPTIVAATVNKLVFTTVPSGNQTASATATIGAYQVQEQDIYGNPVTAAAAVTVNLVTTSAGTTGPVHVPFFTPTSGGGVGTAVTIAIGQSTAAFYYSDTKAGTPTLTASATGMANATTAPTVVPAVPNKLAYVIPPPTAGTHGVALTSFTVAVEDTYGNIETTGNAVTLSLASKPNLGAFSSGTATYINVAAVNGTVTFAGVVMNKAGSYTFKASDTKAPDTGLTTATSITPTVLL